MPYLPRIARADLHFWEEPCISGDKGSGAIFFSGCSLKCVFCQNFDISHKDMGKTVSVKELADIFKMLEDKGAHNINFVNPTHYTYAIEKALEIYKPKIPLVYNSGGYDLTETIKKDIFDIYLFDLKYLSSDTALLYSGAADYPQFAKDTIITACKIKGEPVYINGIMQSGVIVRHLVLPRHTNEAISVADWVFDNVPWAVFSLMAQYIPLGNADKYPEINRKITQREYDKVVNYISDKRTDNIYIQDLPSADACYVPDFNLK